jgi:hypothetical protein
MCSSNKQSEKIPLIPSNLKTMNCDHNNMTIAKKVLNKVYEQRYLICPKFSSLMQLICNIFSKKFKRKLIHKVKIQKKL